MAVAKRRLGRTGFARSRPGLRRDGIARRAACSRYHRRPSGNHPRQGTRRRHQLHRHLDRLRAQRGTDRPHTPHRRSKYYLASKCGCLVGALLAPRANETRTSSPATVVAGVEQSLANEDRLLDVGAAPFLAVPADPAGARCADAPVELKAAGRCGLSVSPGHRLSDRAHRHGCFEVLQIPYSAVEREHEAAIAVAAQKGAGIVIRGGAAKGAPTEGEAGRAAMGTLAPGACSTTSSTA